MSKPNSYILAGKRSPIGRFLGGLSKLSAMQVGAQVAKAAIADARVNPADIDEVFIGQVLQAGCGQNPARQVALAADIPDKISCTTINKVCGSGLQCLMFADQVIRAGDADIILAGGMESMSNTPFYSRTMRTGNKFGNTELIDGMLYDGLTNVYDNEIMGAVCECTAKEKNIDRASQDRWAVRSHERAAQAASSGAFDAERVAIEVPREKAPFNTDETIRTDATFEGLSALKPAFSKDGTITAGNASTLSDGAAMTLVASEAGLRKLGRKPLARIVAQATAGGPPGELFLAPIAAGRMACERAGWDLRSVDLWEINEAFAAQMVACVRGLELDESRVNVNGGAIALGHPIGCSGTRVLVTLLHALHARGAKRGVAALCLGGGNAVALAVETV